MFPSVTNLFIYIALFSGLLFVVYSLLAAKKLPILTDLFSVMLAVAAGYSGVDLCYLVLESSKSLGDYQDQKLVIVLGGISVFWVSLTTVINNVKDINKLGAKASIPGASPEKQSGA
ncbi:hypothetical protein L1D12_23365 [Vibrio parahaemolyticus]|uniref:hypothetical protein n=1 Tax=Vibrio parahaemolyticus TaxID=670 RepID=UPI001EFE96A0|nr:hypothetical protein [Vibrio parahaemolyticus]MCG9638163.1 hypothetical protein [Vibrio parahaemolyticus]